MDRGSLFVGILLALLVGLPFLGKAFHQDDTVVLAVSDQILRNPLRPLGGTINWGDDPVPMVAVNKSTPLLGYYLAPFIHYFGHSERVLHGAMIPFLVMLAAGAAMLGQWFWVSPWWAMLFVMLSPPVVASTNVMRDVPAAGMVTLGIALFLRGTDDDRWGLRAWGALLVGLAAITKTAAGAFIPVLALYPLLRREWRLLRWVLVPLGLVGVLWLYTWLVEGVPQSLLLVQRRLTALLGQEEQWDTKLCAVAMAIGSTLFLLPAVFVAWARRRTWVVLPLLVAALAAVVYGINVRFGDPRPLGRLDRIDLADGGAFLGKQISESSEKVVVRARGGQALDVPRSLIASVSPLNWQYYLWAATGAVLLAIPLLGGLVAAGVAAARRTGETAEWILLLAWVGAVLAFAFLGTGVQATRHLLPAVPPLVVMVLRLLGPPRRATTIALAVLLPLQAGVAFLVAAADAEVAEAHRQFARYGAEQYARSGQQVWFNGHGGWQHYAQAQGFRQFSTHGTSPRLGAIILDPKWLLHSQYPNGLQMSVVEEKVYEARMPVQTIDGENGGFYAVTQGRMPYYFSLAKRPVQIGQVFLVETAAR